MKKSKYIFIGFVLIAFAEFVFPSSARAVSIQSQVDAAPAGSTILIQPGTYNEVVTINKAIILKCATQKTCVTHSFIINGSGVTVDGFYSLGSSNYEGAMIVNGNSNTVSNNVIESACMAGIVIKGSSNLALNNEILKSRQCPGSGSDADGIRIFADGNVARGNYIHNISSLQNPTAHIDCFQSWGTLTNATIENNYCYNLESGTTGAGTTGVQTDVGNVHNITIRNNVFRVAHGLNMRGDGISATNNVFVGDYYNTSYVFLDVITGAIFKNNIIYNTTNGIIVGSAYKTGITGGYNIIYNANGAAPSRDSAYFSSTDKWQTMNPAFVNANSGDFHLQSGSPACSAGENGTYAGAYSCGSGTSPVLSAKPGDLNNDAKVDIFDYNLLVGDYGKTGSAGFVPSDIDKNGKVDIFDYNILVGNYGK
jgi:hypothetical protein